MVVMDLNEEFLTSTATHPMISSETVPDFRQQYLSHCDINKYLDSLQTKYPKLVRVKTIGYSFEKRTLKSILISDSLEEASEPNSVIQTVKSPPNSYNLKCMGRFSASFREEQKSSKQKRVILIDGGMHAREWCTISTALHCASQLTDNFEANKDLLDAFDFVIVPIVNVDGYEYSRHHVRIEGI